MINVNIAQLRKQSGLSQADAAAAVGAARATYIKIENGEVSPSLSTLQKICRLHEVGLESVIGDLPESRTYVKKQQILKPEKNVSDEGGEIKIEPENREKFKQLLLYVLSQVGAKPNIGETALYKLLYFIEFDYFEKYQKQLTGARYMKNHFGPTPISFKSIVDEMVNDKQIDITTGKFYKYKQRKYMPMVNADLSGFDAEALLHIEHDLARLSDKTAAELSDLSHLDTPWRIAKDRESVDYRAVFYRTKDTSVRDHSNDEL